VGGPYTLSRGYDPYDSYGHLKIPFVTPIDPTNLEKLTNDHSRYDPQWPPIPSKLLYDIPPFEGKPQENDSTHITNIHLNFSWMLM